MKLTKRKDGRWHKKIMLPDGKSKYFYSNETTERKAGIDINKQILNYQHTACIHKHNFKMIAQKMLDRKMDAVSFKTVECYSTAIIHLSCFENENIEDITPIMLTKLLENMAKQGYSYSSINKVKLTFGQIINYAIVYEELNLTNFVSSVRLPKGISKNKISSPEDKVISKIITHAETAFFGMWAMILLCTGMRRGELAALQRKDIDFDNSEIHIWRSVEFINNQAKLKNMPKTNNSIRTVPILGMLCQPLYNMCKDMEPDSFIFGSIKPLSETTIKKSWNKYCRELNINIHQHQLRHAYAKILYRSGVDPKTAQGLLGHANINTTMDIYTDFSKDMSKKSLTQINNFLSENYA